MLLPRTFEVGLYTHDCLEKSMPDDTMQHSNYGFLTLVVNIIHSHFRLMAWTIKSASGNTRLQHPSLCIGILKNFRVFEQKA